MKRIGLTQRVEVVPAYHERRDCLDQSWARFLTQAGFFPVPLSNAVVEVSDYLDALDLTGVILTGGNDIARLEGARNPAPERDRFEWTLVSACRDRRLPVVGICRGMQVLNLSYDGRLKPMAGHVATRHTVTWEGRQMDVNSYHAYAILEDGLGVGLEPTARGADGTVEALRHIDGTCYGCMWHPERETPFRERDLAFIRRIFGAEAP